MEAIRSSTLVLGNSVIDRSPSSLLIESMFLFASDRQEKPFDSIKGTIAKPSNSRSPPSTNFLPHLLQIQRVEPLPALARLSQKP